MYPVSRVSSAGMLQCVKTLKTQECLFTRIFCGFIHNHIYELLMVLYIYEDLHIHGFSLSSKNKLIPQNVLKYLERFGIF